MDIESRLQKMEAWVHQTWTLVSVVLVLLLVLGLRFLPIDWILVALVIYLLASAAFGLWRFWASRISEAELQERILRGFIAERAKARERDPDPRGG